MHIIYIVGTPLFLGGMILVGLIILTISMLLAQIPAWCAERRGNKSFTGGYEAQYTENSAFFWFAFALIFCIPLFQAIAMKCESGVVVFAVLSGICWIGGILTNCVTSRHYKSG